MTNLEPNRPRPSDPPSTSDRATRTLDHPAGALEPEMGDDMLNGGSGETDDPDDPPNQGADPRATRDVLHGGSGDSKPGD